MVKKSEEKEINIEKDLGFTLLNNSKYSHVSNKIPTFYPQIDALCNGGIPLQRITEIVGQEQIGKSTFSIELVKACSKLGVKTFIIDSEGTSDRDRFKELGVDSSDTYIAQPSDGEVLTIELAGEMLLKVMKAFQGKRDPIVCILDSVGGTPSQVELDTKLDEEGRRGSKAAAVTKLVTKLNPLVKKTNVAVVLINQLRANQNMMNKFDKKFVRTGGYALGYADSLRLMLTRHGSIKDEDNNEIGHGLKVTVDKPKISRPHQNDIAWIYDDSRMSTSLLKYKDFPDLQIPFDKNDDDKIDYTLSGIDYEANLFEEAHELKLVTKRGGYYIWADKDTGEEYKYYKKDFLFLLKQNYQSLRTKLFHEVLYSEFPYRYPVLDNEDVDVTQWPDMSGVKEHYQKIAKEENKSSNKSSKVANKKEGK